MQHFFTAALLLAGSLYALGAVVVVVATRRAPVGFEDDQGFHYSDREAAMPEIASEPELLKASVG